MTLRTRALARVFLFIKNSALIFVILELLSSMNANGNGISG
jgi:hypothetical protein